jgi:hypothetical protein
MKISPDLSRAVKAVVHERNSKVNDYERRRKEIRAWINKTPKVRRLFERYERLQKQCHDLSDQISEVGLRAYNNDVEDAEKLTKAGFPGDVSRKLDDRTIIARLSMATPENGVKILKELGSIWDEPAVRKS